MIMDALLEFATDAALSTVGTGLALVGNVIDLGAPPQGSVFRDIGGGAPLYLVIIIGSAAVTSAGAATLAFSLASDAQAAIAVDGTASLHVTTAAIAKATLVAGYLVAVVPLPRDGGVPYERYLGILQNAGTAALTAGKVRAFLTTTPPNWKAYTDGI